MKTKSLLPQSECPRCGYMYSSLRMRCPKCNSPRVTRSSRAVNTSADLVDSPATRRRLETFGRWQMIFAAILTLTVVLAVAVLALSGDGSPRPAKTPSQSGSQSGGASGAEAVTISDTYLPTPSPSPEPTPEVDQNAITSMEMIFLNKTVGPDITMSNDGELAIQLECRVFPQNANVEMVWSSSDERILTVDQTGLVQVVGVDPNNSSNATITVTAGGREASVIIRVPYYQAIHLTDNKFLSANG